ncbi:AN1-type zinc finger protein 6-like [Artemia franciscana]|uniref:AN1-type zinc finger protein 6 n=2 Tax=Artemia franciscana TaxID=6661 RepID=A0AA88HXU2_ARTSF|nr:hypothetical protein QYM36_004817 [Artemia franciscana]KAK2719109.1 hypothetical protein QYM36_004817 [Artemia franciscana]KAK2719110.1 hypothetical protein QYM36_004817 [Artemia franciscana]KAK2719111.1 hypothetical protein QYM36_004817 [Artemia franciscana]KAK2719112.1 hypothetical protein QYM36_004817 [Artemia franciscana]
MEQESNQMQSQPTLCRSGCGFYGNPGTEGMCSICFKEALKKKQAPPMSSSSAGRTSPSVLFSQSLSSSSPTSSQSIVSPVVTAQPTVPSVENVEDLASPSTAALAASTSSTSLVSAVSDVQSETSSVASLESVDGGDKKKKGNRCTMCRKKVGLTGFECRCGGMYCAVHRYSDKHDCTFDYREHGAEEIRRNNPIVVGQKIQKI